MVSKNNKNSNNSKREKVSAQRLARGSCAIDVPGAPKPLTNLTILTRHDGMHTPLVGKVW